MKHFNHIDEIKPYLLDRDPFEGRPWVMGEGDENPDVHLIKVAPSFADMTARKAFMGDDGRVIRKMLFELGLTAYFSTAIPYVPAGKLKLSDLRVFAPLLTETLERVGCRNIVMFGADVVKMASEFDVPFKKFSELLHRTIEANGYRFCILPHSQVLAYSPTRYPEMKRQIQSFVFPPDAPRKAPVTAEVYSVHTDRESALKALSHMSGPVACDLETTGLDPYSDRILTIQLSWTEGQGHAFVWDLLTPREWAQLLRPYQLIFHNGTFDIKFLAQQGVRLPIYEDTMLMHSLIDEVPGGHSMEQLARRYLGIDKWSDQINYTAMEENDIQTLGEYGARDTDITLRLANVFRPQVEGRVIHKVLHDAQNSLIKSELKGIKVNRELALDFQSEIEKALHDRRIYMADTYGLENPGSVPQVSKLLYETMGLPKQKLKGAVTTNEAALAKLGDLAVVKDIVEYRHLVKALGTYIRPLLDASELDGRYHPEFRLAATETGRLAEKMVLLIPRADDRDTDSLGKRYQYRLRELFIPDDGFSMLGADFSGLEVAVVAQIAGDKQLIQDIVNKVDTHSAVAVQAFDLDIPLEPAETLKARVSEHHSYERTLAKSGTFAWLYGGDEGTIARNLGVSKDIAEKILTTLRDRYSGVAEWHEAIHEQVRREGWVSTPWGRRRNFVLDNAFSNKVNAEQLRESINAPIQGTGSDMALKAYSELTDAGIWTLFPMHDAIYAQAPHDRVQVAAAKIRSVMEGVLPGPVPFRVDIGVGSNWGELH